MRSSDDLEVFEASARMRYIAPCDLCEGLGRETANPSEKCACTKFAERDLAYYASCIPRRFWTVKVEDIKGQPAEMFDRRVKPFLVNFRDALASGVGLYIYGDNGAGKTMIASYAARRVREAGFSVYFTTAADMLESMKRGFGDSEVAEKIKMLLESELLVIDELGTEVIRMEPNWARAQIARILKARENECTPTILVSNLHQGELIEAYGKGVQSVIDGYYIGVPLESHDGRSDFHPEEKLKG